MNKYMMLIKWIDKLTMYYDIDNNTYNLFIYILHKFIEKKPFIFIENIACIGFCCLSLAFKYNEGYDNDELSFRFILKRVLRKHAFTLEEFKHFEFFVFKTIEFHIPLEYDDIMNYIHTSDVLFKHDKSISSS